MTLEQLVARLVDALDQASIPYMLVGSLSTNFYGVSRGTQDADLVVSCEGAKINDLLRALGNEFERDPQLAFETVTATNKTLLRVKKTGFKIEVFFLSQDEHDQQRFARRKLQVAFGTNAYLPTLEDVLIQKLRWLHSAARRKDEEDVRVLLTLHRNDVDWPYVQAWCDQHGTLDLLQRLRDETQR